MQIIKLEIEESKLEIFLNIIQNLKDDVISKYELLDEDSNENKNFMNLSRESLTKVWDNKEDSVYDKFL